MTELHYANEPTHDYTVEDLDHFLWWCFEQGVSDIIISTRQKMAVIQHDEVIEVGRRPIKNHEIEGLLVEIDQPASPGFLTTGQPRDFSYKVMLEHKPEASARFRVSATGMKDGIEVVFRTIPSEPPSVAALNVEQHIIDSSKAEYGLVLITGPTGSGKSTLCAALLRDVAEKERKHIITYEAPIEFDLNAIPNRLARIAQTELPVNVQTFPMGAANALRRKPHVILVGEARDAETIAGLITNSQTGHLVYSTVHTNSVPMTISRMVDVFPDAERKSMTAKLVDAMRLIVHQRLVKRPNGKLIDVKEYLVFTEEIRRQLLEKLSDPRTVDLGVDITRYLHSSGQPLLVDVERKYKDGLISDMQYKALISELANKKEA